MAYSSPGHSLPELLRDNTWLSPTTTPAARGEGAALVLSPHLAYFPSETLTCPELGAPGTPLLRGLLRGGGTLIMRTPKMHAIYAARPTASLSRQFLVCVSFCLSGPRSFASARDT